MTKKHQKKIASEYWSYPAMTRALEIALYYGFTPQEPVTIEKNDRECVKCFASPSAMHIVPEEKAGLIRHWFAKNSAQAPISVATLHDQERQSRRVNYSLDILGTNRSIADATLIKTIYEIAKSEGYQGVNLELNSIGDRDSFSRYSRELANYQRKHIHELNSDCRPLVKKDIYTALDCGHSECQTVANHLPHSMNYLSEPSRNYFMELLELLETSQIPYSINNGLLANHECALHTIFRVTGNQGQKIETVAQGCRWGLIAKKIGLRKDIQGVSATVEVKRTQKIDRLARIPKPKCYFIQMGQEAKLRSLSVIEVLRQSKIPVYHSLTKDKLTAQLMSAEILNVPYVLIMGQKESLENTVLIREMFNRSQETVHIEDAGLYLRKCIG